MTVSAEPAAPARPWSGRVGSPLAVFGLVLCLVPLLLALPLKLPIGPMYWDVMVYYDAAQRIHLGQIPVVDFFTPVGPLGYYLFAGWLWLFPGANPILIAHWSLLAVTAPLMALVVAPVAERSKATAIALIVPFLIFTLLPFNTREYYPFPGSDGFGIYNRQVCQVLFVLVAALTFLRDGRRLGIVVATTMTALFFLKITGFVSGAIVCLFAFACGRLSLRVAAAAAIAFLAVLAVLEIACGLNSHYIRDILLLVEMNAGALAPRFLQAMSQTFGVLLPATVLGCLLLWTDRARLREKLDAARQARSATAAMAVLDHPGLWIGAVLLAGVFFETQNTGSQAMIFVWPVVVSVLLRAGRLIARPALLIAVFVLSAAATLHPMVEVIERAARTYGGSIKNLPLESRNLKALGEVTMRRDVAERADKLMRFYPEHRVTFEELVKLGELPSFILFSDYDFQILHLRTTDQAVESIRALEQRAGIRFETIMALNFVNPYPWLLDRAAPRHIAIGADPTRAVPAPDAAVLQAIRDADLVVRPTCPPTTANAHLFRLYQPALAEHRTITLDSCNDAYVHPRFAGKLP